MMRRLATGRRRRGRRAASHPSRRRRGTAGFSTAEATVSSALGDPRSRSTCSVDVRRAGVGGDLVGRRALLEIAAHGLDRVVDRRPGRAQCPGRVVERGVMLADAARPRASVVGHDQEVRRRPLHEPRTQRAPLSRETGRQ